MTLRGLIKEFARAIPADTAEFAYRKFYAHVEDAVLKVISYGPEVALEFDRVVRICYRATPVVPIRALDGLLPASALLAPISGLVSTDLRMLAAAVLLVLRIFPANPM